MGIGIANTLKGEKITVVIDACQLQKVLRSRNFHLRATTTRIFSREPTWKCERCHHIYIIWASHTHYRAGTSSISHTRCTAGQLFSRLATSRHGIDAEFGVALQSSRKNYCRPLVSCVHTVRGQRFSTVIAIPTFSARGARIKKNGRLPIVRAARKALKCTRQLPIYKRANVPRHLLHDLCSSCGPISAKSWGKLSALL